MIIKPQVISYVIKQLYLRANNNLDKHIYLVIRAQFNTINENNFDKHDCKIMVLTVVLNLLLTRLKRWIM